jgi:hypothetical protein
MRVDDVAGIIALGAGIHCSPRHRVPFDSRREGSKCVGSRGEQYPPGPRSRARTTAARTS